MSSSHPATPKQLWLVRHGETEWSKTGQHTGRADIALTPSGEAEALSLPPRLAGRSFALVLSSPLQRAWRTCQLAGYDAVAQPEPNLMEWAYGDYEGLTSHQIQQQVPGWTIFTHPVPHGETAAEVVARAERVISRALAVEGDVLLFAHGHLLRVLATTWLGWPPEQGRHLALHTASISVLGFEHATRAILRWNQK